MEDARRGTLTRSTVLATRDLAETGNLRLEAYPRGERRQQDAGERRAGNPRATPARCHRHSRATPTRHRTLRIRATLVAACTLPTGDRPEGVRQDPDEDEGR